MSGRVKLSLIMLVVLAVSGLALAHIDLGWFSRSVTAPVATGEQASGRLPKIATPAAPGPSVAALFADCVESAFPTPADAKGRADTCSKALQTRQLKPDEIALARLTRGIARTLLGNRELASDDYLDAVQRYDRLIDPANPDALSLYRRAAALDASGQIDRALEDYTAAIKADPKASLAYLGRGVLLAARKRAFDRAIEDFDKVLEIEPANVDALIARGDAFSNLGDAGRAITDLNRAIALAPNRAPAYLVRGLAEARRGNRTGARQDYQAALRNEPHNVDARVNLAALSALEGNFAASVHDLDEAIALDPGNALAFYNRGYANFSLRRYDPAVDDYSSAIRLDPQFGVAYNNRALVRAIRGNDLVQALADSDAALKLLPVSLDVRETRGFVFLKLGDPALALHEYNTALDMDPNRAVSLYGRGLARIGLGKTGDGQLDQAAALTINPEVGRDFANYGL